MIPVYNKVGKGYNSTRNADPYLTERMYELLAPVDGGNYLDIGCGTGNYMAALTQKGLQFTGVEPSDVMLEQAIEKYPALNFIKGTAEALPFDDELFNGVNATFTIHHWTDHLKGLQEIYRVLKPGSRLVLLSFTPEQLLNYWLCKYFPDTMQRSSEVVPPMDSMVELFQQAGFQNIETEKYFVHEGLTDLFLYANKYRPESYLDPEIRKGASSFTVYADEEEVAKGLAQLEQDIKSGEINKIIQEYENELGDYLFYIAHKA